MRSILLGTIVTVFLCMGFWGCTAGGGGDSDPGEIAQIPANVEIIVFPGGAGWGDVTFTHATHANEYYDGECIHCHDHETVGAETHWSCSECHSAGTDAEELCEEYTDHGCIMTQCQNCHLQEGGNPAPDGDACGDCHGSPEYAETIVFSGGGGYGPVGFTHKKHAEEYYEGNCMECHDHDEGVWVCGDCHTRGADAEDLCVETEDHGCIMAQCQDCHVQNGPPAPDGEACGDCHGFPQYASVIEFPGGGNCESVTFMHEQHAMDYSGGHCHDCHKMEADFWMCRVCHTVGGVGGPNDANCEISDYFDPVHGAYHGCISYQCMKCHKDYPDSAPDGLQCVDCHAGCDCPQDPCVCSDCHASYHQDACTACHPYENHSSNWEPCTNTNCHAKHTAMATYVHTDWTYCDNTFWTGCTNTPCHASDLHAIQACNDCHSFPAPSYEHNYDSMCLSPMCHETYDTAHPGTPGCIDCSDCTTSCHEVPAHDAEVPWATCVASGLCHDTDPGTSLTICQVHEQKACNDAACHHYDYPATHDNQSCYGLNNNRCHAINDYPFNFNSINGSHDTWDPCVNAYCHPELLP